MAYLWETHLSRASGNFDPMYHQKPRSEIIPFITWTPQNILDIGCGAGATGKLIKEKFPACRIYGVELTPEAAKVASQTYDQVIIGNVEGEEWLTSDLPIGRIDTVLLLDVLEHLYNPWQFLAELKKRLPDDCRLVASIPNAFNIQLLDELASGHWQYGPWGLLDITHIRFFTEAEMIRLFHDTGFSVAHIGDIPHPESMLPQVVEHSDHQVATSNVTVRNLDAKTSNDLLVIQKVLIVENRLAVPDTRPVPSLEIGHRSAPGSISSRAVPTTLASLRETYLDLIRKCILGLIYDDPTLIPKQGIGSFSAESRENGRDWPSVAHSMIGNKRMLNLQRMAEHVVNHNVPGDFIETGVWRGGACIMMRAVLNAYDISDRTVWVADSFEGLPRPDADRYPADSGDDHFIYEELAIPLTQVQENFSKYGLLDEQVRFLKGWFRDTLPDAPVSRLALMRLDGDMYESTMDALVNLFPKLSPGGIVIIDDYGYIKSCRQAVEDYRAANGITDPIHDIDGFGVYWQNLLPNRFSAPADGARPIAEPTRYSESPAKVASASPNAAQNRARPVEPVTATSPTLLNPRLLSDQQKYKRAKELIGKGALIEGADLLIELAQADTAVASVYHDLGVLAGQQGDSAAAKDLFQAAVAKSPQPPTSCLELARIERSEGNFEAALASLSPYLRTHRNDADALALVREILGAGGELSAVAWARLLIDLRQEDTPNASAQ